MVHETEIIDATELARRWKVPESWVRELLAASGAQRIGASRMYPSGDTSGTNGPRRRWKLGSSKHRQGGAQ